MVDHQAIVIGGSAGSLNVLLEVLPALRKNISLAIIIVLHRKPGADSLLTNILSLKTRIPVREIEEKEKIQPGVIYLAPSDYHLLIEKDYTFSLDHSEKVHYSRPSIDVAFESAADVFQEKLVGLLLSGANADGVQGLKNIKKMGGKAVIQHPDSAAVPYMPGLAQNTVNFDTLLKIEEIGSYINSL